jgi:hypothetical protein
MLRTYPYAANAGFCKIAPADVVIGLKSAPTRVDAKLVLFTYGDKFRFGRQDNKKASHLQLGRGVCLEVANAAFDGCSGP